MKRKLIAIAAAAAFFSAPALAHGPMMGGGMMGGYGAQGMGPGMMGPGMMGPGTMGGYGDPGIDLSDEQRAKIADIRREAARKQWELMGRLHEQQFHMHDFFGPGKVDESAARKAYDQMAAAHKQMFETTLEARQRVNAVLTDEQRKQLERAGRGSAWGG